MITIKKEWESYLAMVVPPDAGPNQIEGTRLAFYAGAIAIFSAVCNAEGPDQLAEFADELVAHHDELLKMLLPEGKGGKPQ